MSFALVPPLCGGTSREEGGTRAVKYLVMVCHTETWWKTGGWQRFDEVLDGFRAAWDAADCGDKRPLVTFCLTSETVEDKAEVLAALRAEGHEIGVHSHLPGSQRQPHTYVGQYAYALDERGVLNQDAAAAGIRDRIIDAGLGTPETHVSGMFAFRDTTASVLEESGFRVDCSLMPGDLGTHGATGDFVLVKIVRGESEPQTVMEVQSDGDTASDPSISERQEDVHRDDRGRDVGAFLELWPD